MKLGKCFNSSRRHHFYRTARATSRLAAFAAAAVLTSLDAHAQSPVVELLSGLERPLGITQSNQRNLIVSEIPAGAPNIGRLSIVDFSGQCRTLVDGLPSAINAVNERNGPAGLFMRGRTLYVLIGEGDNAITGPLPGTAVPNPNGPSSPIFSSLLAIHFSAGVEKKTEGLTLSLADQHALAHGETVTLSNGRGDRMMIELIADFIDFTPEPVPGVPDNVRLSNPFDLVVVADQAYVADASQNLVWQVDMATGVLSALTGFPTIPNPLFPGLGRPFIEAVPTGICHSDGQLLVALFRGNPFPPGTSVVEQVDPFTGNHAPFITGLKTAIKVLPIRNDDETSDYLVLQHASSGPFFGSPGLVLRFAASGGAPIVIADGLARPTSMALDERTGILYVTEYAGGLLAIPVAP